MCAFLHQKFCLHKKGTFLRNSSLLVDIPWSPWVFEYKWNFVLKYLWNILIFIKGLHFLLSPALQEHFTSIILPLEDIDPFISWGWFLKLEDCIQNLINNLQTLSCCSLNRPQNMTCPAFKTLSPSMKLSFFQKNFLN